MAVIQDQPYVLVARPWQIPSRAATFVGITAVLVWFAWSDHDGPVLAAGVLGLAAWQVWRFLIGTPVLAKMTVTGEHLVVRRWPTRRDVAWADVKSLQLTGDLSQQRSNLLVTFLDGRPVRVIYLEEWRTRRQEQWPQAILDQVRAHGIQMSDEDRSFLLTGFTSWRGMRHTRLDDPRVMTGRVQDSPQPRSAAEVQDSTPSSPPTL